MAGDPPEKGDGDQQRRGEWQRPGGMVCSGRRHPLHSIDDTLQVLFGRGVMP